MQTNEAMALAVSVFLSILDTTHDERKKMP